MMPPPRAALSSRSPSKPPGACEADRQVRVTPTIPGGRIILVVAPDKPGPASSRHQPGINDLKGLDSATAL
jgi:hypothetical protein